MECCEISLDTYTYFPEVVVNSRVSATAAAAAHKFQLVIDVDKPMAATAGSREERLLLEEVEEYMPVQACALHRDTPCTAAPHTHTSD